MTTPTMEQRLADLESRLKDRPRKDFWDILGAVGGILTPLVVAFLGIYLPGQLNKDQKEREAIAAEAAARVAKANVIPPLMDALLSQDPTRRQLAISTLLIALPTEGPQIASVVATSDPNLQVQQYATASLDRRRESLVSALFAEDSSTRIDAANSLLAGWRDDSAVVANLLTYASTHRNHSDGVYNTAVVLGSFSTAPLIANRAALRDFAVWARDVGSKTKAVVDRLQRRVE